jgi:hypothetical protein
MSLLKIVFSLKAVNCIMKAKRWIIASSSGKKTNQGQNTLRPLIYLRRCCPVRSFCGFFLFPKV